MEVETLEGNVAISGWPVVSAFSSGQSVELASGTCPPGRGVTGKYAIHVVTRDSLLAGSRNLVQLWLVGEQGEADLGKKLWPVRSEFEVSVPVHLGCLLLAKLRKILLDAWFCERISARPGTQGEARFPRYRRVRGDQVVCLPEGTARTLSDDHQDFLQAQREQELQERKKVYRWGSRKDGPILPVAGGREDAV
ncbi:polyunsaturated fatty acid (12S)/(13S)-lipoxygenase [Prionailurus iriomotensis]